MPAETLAERVDAFDADVLIYAAAQGHRTGRRVRALFNGDFRRVGSVLLVPEVLSKPLRDGAREELEGLVALLDLLELRPTDRATADFAASLAALYRLRAADAVHLATAVGAGADRFITNNKADFPKSIVEIDVTYPEDLPE